MLMAKSETGTQLLARLGARPSLSGLESSLFGTGPETGGVYEFYGGEGTGKTEMALHLIAKCVLPEIWQDIPVGGKGTGVIVVDTEHKFPVFRLAVILEHWIKSAVDKSSVVTPVASEVKTKCEIGDYFENGKANALQDMPVEKFSEEDFESFIQSCLRKLHILQCGSSFQFLVSLTSLESLISSDPNISMIVIDTISAYYWIDKCSVPDSHQALDAIMKPIISVLSNYVTDHNMVLVCVKSAILVKKTGHKVGYGTKGDNSSHPDFSLQSASCQSREGSTSDHIEFLGKSWNKFVTKRYIFTQSAIGSMQTVMVTANNDGQTTKVKFKVLDSGIQFIS